MELLLGIVVFLVLGAITVYGYRSSERDARERWAGDADRGARAEDYRPIES